MNVSTNQYFGNYLFKLVPLVRKQSSDDLSRLFFTIQSISVNVHQPKDRVTINHQGYGFVEFLSEEDADYAIKIMNMIKLYGKPIRVNKVCIIRWQTTMFNRFNLHLGFSTSEKS